VVAERTGLAEHGVNQSGLTVVYVGNNCDVAQVISGGLSHRNILIVSAPRKFELGAEIN
jgi:hypothetical protein